SRLKSTNGGVWLGPVLLHDPQQMLNGRFALDCCLKPTDWTLAGLAEEFALSNRLERLLRSVR
ncbi:MAG: hypothetical protein LPJ94_03875, partial [Thauera sp.]|nr:hypothetical protein [Alphaproteobacteria bacterium]MDX5409346.1 hypothetical protein [Thauera sp.]